MSTRYRILSAVLFLFFIGGCATAPRGGRLVDTNDLKILCSRYGVDWNFDSGSQAVRLKHNSLEAQALVGSPVVMIGKERIVLNAPLKRRSSTILVPPDFKSKVLDRLLQEQSFVISKFRKIVVDAGHGGKDPGAIGHNGAEEKVVVLDIAQRLKKNLEKRGIDVVMTRSSDEFISLQERTEIASRAKADLFVSVHANSSRTRSVKGLEIYYLRDLTWEEKREDQLKKNQRMLLANASMQKTPELDDILFDMFYTYKQAESRDVARYVSNHACRMIQAHGRGTKTAGFFVLKNTLIPAILVEVGFLTNAQEEKLLMTGSYRQAIADALAKSILGYAKK